MVTPEELAKLSAEEVELLKEKFPTLPVAIKYANIILELQKQGGVN